MSEIDPYSIARTAKGFRARAGLIDAGMRILGDLGLAGLSVEAVCAEAEIGRTSFYNYFTNIEILLEVIAETFLEDFSVQLDGFQQGLPRGAKRLAKCLLGTLERAAVDPEWGATAAQLNISDSKLHDLFRSEISMEISAGIAAGSLKLQPAEIPAYINLLTVAVFSTASAFAVGTAHPQDNATLVHLLLRAADWTV